MGTSERLASASSATSSPWSKAAGWIPRASSRSSSSDCASSSARRGHQPLRAGGIVADPTFDEGELQRKRDQPLLGAVVQVALDPTPFGVPGGDDPFP